MAQNVGQSFTSLKAKKSAQIKPQKKNKKIVREETNLKGKFDP